MKKREKQDARRAAPRRLRDEDLSAACGAGASKSGSTSSGTSKADLPTETIAFNYGKITWTY